MAWLIRLLAIGIAVLAIGPAYIEIASWLAMRRELAADPSLTVRWDVAAISLALHGTLALLGAYAAIGLSRLRRSGWWASIAFLVASILYVAVFSWTSVLGEPHPQGASAVILVHAVPLIVLSLPACRRACES